MKEQKVVDVKRMDWFCRPTSTTGKMFGQKRLVEDPDMGMSIVMNRYPAGFTTERHRHPAAHGFYVLSGQIRSNDEYYGPGTVIRYEEGCIAEHGANAYEDLICLQISNKHFSIEYMDREMN